MARALQKVTGSVINCFFTWIAPMVSKIEWFVPTFHFVSNLA